MQACMEGLGWSCQGVCICFENVVPDHVGCCCSPCVVAAGGAGDWQRAARPSSSCSSSRGRASRCSATRTRTGAPARAPWSSWARREQIQKAEELIKGVLEEVGHRIGCLLCRPWPLCWACLSGFPAVSDSFLLALWKVHPEGREAHEGRAGGGGPIRTGHSLLPWAPFLCLPVLGSSCTGLLSPGAG